MTTLTHAHSPLAQAQRQNQVEVGSQESDPPSNGKSTKRRVARRLSNQEKALVRRLLDEKYEWIDNPEFHQDDEAAEKQFFDDAPEIEKPDTTWYHPVMDNVTEIRNTRNVKTVLLTAAEERVIFFQFNYARFRVCRIREQLQQQRELDPEQVREMLRWYDKADALRDQIARTNLALVLAMAKRTRMSEMDFADLVSEGNMALMRAVDKFDAGRGFKFSTYACRAILKAFSRQGVKLSKYRSLFPTDFDPKLERSDYLETKREEHEDACVEELRRILTTNKADLSGIEREVIEHRFGVNKPKPKNVDPRSKNSEVKPLTLEQVGKIIGVTKERVRQIQNKALDKIRDNLENDFLR